MIRHLQIEFEDAEFQLLLKAKADMTWHDFIMLLTNENGERPATILSGGDTLIV
jgi:hypothetical protein